MKKIVLYITLFLSVCGLQSCLDDFLTQLPYSTSTPETFYKTETDFEQALTGCYAVINASSIGGASGVTTVQVALGTYNYGLFYMLDGCSDIAIAGVGSGSHYDVLRGSYQTSQTEIRAFWIAFFNGISRCNYLLAALDGSELTPEQKIQFEGETRFLRAFYYLHLAQMFGGVPYYDTPNPDPQAARDNLETVYGHIIDDLKFAYDKLSGTGIFRSSANKWTAGAYLGCVYNYLASCKRYGVGAKLVKLCPLNSFSWVNEEQMSTDARDILAEVITSSGYELVPAEDYRYLFYEMSKSIQYRECLFMSEFANNVSHAASIYYILSPAGIDYGGSYQRVFPTMKLYKSYADKDVRRDRFITGIYNPNGKYNNVETGVPYEMVNGVKYYLPDPSSGAASGMSYTLWSTGKFRVSDPKGRTVLGIRQCEMNHPLMRMADVHLQYAEALYFCNDENGARKQLEKVRSRVVASDGTLENLTTTYFREDFVEELLEERARELCFESKRKVDLIRFGKITEYIQDLPAEGTNNLVLGVETLKDNWREYKIWFPIPQLEIDLNANLEQNPIYVD